MSVKYFRHFMAVVAIVVLLWGVRVYATGSLMYAFLLWNIFLAAIPLMIAFVVLRLKLKGVALVLMSAVWLLFFPNAPYIITDLYHLDHIQAVAPRLWYDPLMVFVAAYSGVKMGFVSLQMMECQWRSTLWLQWFPKASTRFRMRARQVLLLLLFGATGFGMYAGRVLRWNSWDVLSRPLHLLKDASLRFISPQQYLSAWGFVCLYGLVLFVLYCHQGRNYKWTA